MDRTVLENAIASLEALLLLGDVPEAVCQAWFESHPSAFDCLGYSRVVAHPDLTENSRVVFTPDFMVQRADSGRWEIFEINTPGMKLLKPGDRRKTFYADTHSYLAQCREYSAYFDDAAHRNEFAGRTGIQVYKSPTCILVGGKGADASRAEAARLAQPIHLVTYDDVLARVEFYRARLYAELENLAGLSVYSFLRVRKPRKAGPNFLLDFFADPEANRASIFVDQADRLCFRVLDETGREETMLVPHGEKTWMYDEWTHFTFEAGEAPDYLCLSLDIWGCHYAFKKSLGTVVRFPKPLYYVLGSDMSGQVESSVCVAQQAVFRRTLEFQEKLKLHRFFMTNQRSSPGNHMRFEGSQFLHTRNHPNFVGAPPGCETDLVQMAASHRPTYIEE